ncbi:MAG: hypothetical protein KGD68_06725 [Candidatus Lokiarchaeota archaeon]|nr:hypothetical protein [Candidatus Lokiarchaeota archaeon]
MTKKLVSEIISERFGVEKYKESVKYPINKINIISLKENPIKIRSIIFDKEREYHLIIDERRNEIFHDCDIFFSGIDIDNKACPHLIKLLLMIKPSISKNILNNINNFNFTSEDYSSKKKSKNYLELANISIENNNCIEGLNYLNKAIFSNKDCEPIIEKYLKTAIENNLSLELFEFLQSAYSSDLGSYLHAYDNFIEEGFKSFLKSASIYTFFDLLRIIEYIDKILDYYEFKNESFVFSLISNLIRMAKSNIFNEKYLSIYFIKKKFEILVKSNPIFKDILTSKDYEAFKHKLLNYFLEEIDNFIILDKLKLMKKQFDVFEIPKKQYYEEYKTYKNEIKELEKKVYLKKFAFLRYFKEKYNIKKTKIDFRKKRNAYEVNHDKENLKNPAYIYVINHLGFYGVNESIIKPSEIGLNYLIFEELFLDDLHNYHDILYYKTKFWGEENKYEINTVDVFSLLSKPTEYNYDVDQSYSSIGELTIIEWDLASKPSQSSLVNAYGVRIVIPDQNTALFHDIKPFDLCFCQKNPTKIEGNLVRTNIVRTINIITKCSFKDAISSIEKGMSFIEGYYPLSLVSSVLKKKISPFEAYEKVLNNTNRQFIPNYGKFVKAFRKFLFQFINKEKGYVYEILKKNPRENANQFIILLNLTTELSGLDLPYPEIFHELLNEDSDLHEFRKKLMKKIHTIIKDILKLREIGATVVFNLKKMRHTPFVKYSNEILKIRKEEFERSKVYRYTQDDKLSYQISELIKTYYGSQLLEILKIHMKTAINQETFNKILNYSTKLNLNLNVVNRLS